MMSQFIVDLSSPYILVCLFGGMLSWIVSAVLDGLDNLRLDSKDKISKALDVHPLMKEMYDEKTIEASQAYSAKWGFFSQMSQKISSEIDNVVFLLGIPAALVWLGMKWTTFPFPLQIAFVMACTTFIKALLSVPLEILADKIEKAFGYSNLTLKTFITDKVKGYFISVGMLALEVTVAYYALKWLGKLDFAAILAFLVGWQLFNYLVSLLEVYVIEPMFNKYKPLEDGELKTKLKDLVEKYGYRLDNVFVMDESRRSKKGNAYCMSIPFGPKRIVIYDTLMQQLSTDEIVAVFAHELGHAKLFHNQISWIVNFAEMAVMAYAISVFAYNVDVYHAFGFRYVNAENILEFAVIGIWLSSMLINAISWTTAPLQAIMSRKHEYAADRYAAKCGYGKELETGLIKLHAKNGGDLAPSKAWMWWHASHPGIVERVNALKKTNRNV